MNKTRFIGTALLVLIPLSVFGQASSSDSSASFLDKAAVEKMVVGHKLTFLRVEDQNKVSWTIERNGILYGENISLGSKDTARWNLTDKGEFCLKWKGNSRDGCRLFTVVDGKTTMFDSTTPGVVNATVEKID